MAHDEFNQMNEVLVKANVETLDSKLLTSYTISKEFQDQFAAASYYEDVSAFQGKGHVTQSDYFNTEKKSEFDEYTHPTICHYVSYEKNAVD